MTIKEGRCVHLQNNWIALNHYAPTLNWFNKVLWALGDKTESGLMCMKLQDPTQGLLCDNRKVIGII
jgi:hypothetical protein